MSSEPLVTVLIPSYNHEKFVGISIESLQKQTYKNLQIIIIDDCSTDDSVNKIKPYLLDPRIQLITRTKNIGSSYSSNEGIALAKGKYFCMLSSDDVFVPEKIRMQVDLLEKDSRLGAVFSMAGFIDERGESLELRSPFRFFEYSRHDWLNRLFYKGNCLCHPSIMIRTEAYKIVGGYEPMYRSLGDYYMWIKLLGQFEIKVLKDNLILFRIMDNQRNMSGDNPTNRQAYMNEWTYILNQYVRYCNERDFPKIFPSIPLNSEGNDFEFLLGCEAVTQKRAAYRAFGINLLYSIFSDHERIKRIEKLHGFSANDLIRLSEGTDTFHSEEMRSLSKGLGQISIYEFAKVKVIGFLQRFKNQVLIYIRSLRSS
jgi:glycosyltransferase involved in cell wall biosynthesis